jgi:hypothetical protein
MENLRENIERISEIMGLNENANLNNSIDETTNPIAKTAAKKAVPKKISGKSAAQSSVKKTATKKTTPKKTTPKKPTISASKSKVLNDIEISKTLEETLGPTLSKKARREFEKMPDDEILIYVNKYKDGDVKNYSKTINDKLETIFQRDPKWFERWSKRVKSWPLKYQAVFWGVVFFGVVFTLGVIMSAGIVGLIKIMGKPIEYTYKSGSKVGETIGPKSSDTSEKTKDVEKWFKENGYYDEGMTFEVQGDGILWKTSDGNKGYVQKQIDGSYK